MNIPKKSDYSKVVLILTPKSCPTVWKHFIIVLNFSAVIMELNQYDVQHVYLVLMSLGLGPFYCTLLLKVALYYWLLPWNHLFFIHGMFLLFITQYPPRNNEVTSHWRQDSQPWAFFITRRDITWLFFWFKGHVKKKKKQTFTLFWCLYGISRGRISEKKNKKYLLFGRVDCNFCSMQVKSFCWFWEVLSLPTKKLLVIFFLIWELKILCFTKK